jgi:hypothetical protein
MTRVLGNKIAILTSKPMIRYRIGRCVTSTRLGISPAYTPEISAVATTAETGGYYLRSSGDGQLDIYALWFCSLPYEVLLSAKNPGGQAT